MMDEYNIRQHRFLDDIEINSENLFYAQGSSDFSCVQCNVTDEKVTDEIHDKCRQVADLIREIDKLNKL